MGDEPAIVVMDVRHVRSDENVHCSGEPLCNSWATHHLEAKLDPRILGRAEYQVYLCRAHLSRTLRLAEALKVP